jgi:hypothetical protein
MSHWPICYLSSIHYQYPAGNCLSLQWYVVLFCVSFINKVLCCPTVNHRSCIMFVIVMSSDCDLEYNLFLPIIWPSAGDHIWYLGSLRFGSCYLPQESAINFYSWSSSFPNWPSSGSSSYIASASQYVFWYWLGLLVGHHAA